MLVSEIKLYNERKVTEGRDQNDLYERLREYIDRSRDMYDKRVKPEVVQSLTTSIMSWLTRLLKVTSRSWAMLIQEQLFPREAVIMIQSQVSN